MGEAFHWLVLPATLVGGGSVVLLAAVMLGLLLVILAGLTLFAFLLSLPVSLFFAWRG